MNHWEDALYKNKKGSIESNYLKDSAKIETTKRMFDYIDKYFIINKNSEVIEFGCNMGRNLREAYRRYCCKVCGIDINSECLKKNEIKFEKNGVFKKMDLRDGNCLSVFGDKQFDMGITMGTLMHLEKGESKTKLIKNIIRICKNVCFFEMHEKNEEAYYGENGWLVTYEDYRKYDDAIILTEVVGIQNKKLKLFVRNNV